MKGLTKVFSGWFVDFERIRNDKIAKKVCVGEFVGIHLVGLPRKRLIDFANDLLKKKRFECRANKEDV